MKKLKKPESPFWRYLTDFWTVALYGVIVYDFITQNGQAGILSACTVLYAGILTVYCAEKEFERWHGYHREHHIGELYLILWTILIGFLFVMQVVTVRVYAIPPEVVTAYILVLALFAITRVSRNKYESRSIKKARRSRN